MTFKLPNGYAASCVPTDMTDEAWPACRHLIAEALEYTQGFTPEDVRVRILNGLSQLWVVEKDMQIVACAVTEVANYPRAKSLLVWLLCGVNFEQWKECVAQLEMFARAHGCSTIEAVGRRGFEKMVRDLGFTSPRATFVKKVDRATH